MDVIDFYSKPLDPAVIQAQQEECANDPSKKVRLLPPSTQCESRNLIVGTRLRHIFE